ncbi:MAG: Rrf2 family transcriptional regulator, partial [Firmicutes bacterium]|nr:Rrf2 family transcriptional regulator [Bacillota bacterium]
MKLSRKTVYALIFLVDMAKYEGRNITIKEVSEKENISLKYLEQIAGILCKAGLIKSWRGPNGGYHLSKTSKEYTIGEIIRLMDGKITSDYIESINSLSIFWEGLCDTVNEYLDNTTIYDLIEHEKAMEGIY